MWKKSSKKQGVIKGFLDGVEGGYVYGWVWNPANPEERLEVVILADGKPVEEVVADIYREDLEKAGIGDGKYGFKIKLPKDLIDGKEHKISVLVKKLSQEIEGSPKILKLDSPYSYEVYGLKYNYIEGKIVNNLNPEEYVLVEIHEDGKKVAEGYSDPRNGHRFAIFLPKDLCDGKVHVLELRTKEGYTIGYVVDIIPYTITPYDALKEYSKEVPNFLSPVAKYRYEAFVNNVSSIIADKELPREEKEKRIKELYKAYEIVGFGFEKLKEFPTLEFIAYEQPLVSIVIPVHNNFKLTYSCLASILLATYNVPYEVIIVDDGSEDKTTEILDIVKNIKYTRNEKAQGFVLACNKGAKLAKGKFIVILNNDTEVLNGWLKEMLYVFEHFKDVGLVGAKLLYPDLTLQEAGGIVWHDGTAWNYGRGGNAFEPKYNYIRQTSYCSGACIMLPKDLWDELGGFDEEFVPAYWEETDLAFRVREKGYKVFYTPLAQVIHYEGMTAGKDVNSEGMKKYQLINQKKFKQRWSKTLLRLPNVNPSNTTADFVKDENIVGRVLVIDYDLPKSDKEAGGYATFQEIKILVSLGFKVTFLPKNMAYLYGYAEDLQRLGVEVLHAPFYLSVKDVIEERGQEFDLFYIIRWHIAEEYLDLIRRINPHAKIIFNNADLHFLREIREAIARKDKKLLNDAINTRDRELAVMRKVDLVVSYNETEHAVILSHNLDSTKIAKWPWVVYPKEDIPPFEERQDIAFLGNYRHPPNVIAVEFFVKEVMPLLKRRIPDIRFLIYGANAPNEFKKLEAEGAILKGYVKNLDDVFKNIKVFVAPLLSGAGIKGKVLEALSYGVPSVLSPIAAEATGILNNFHAIIAENPKEWVDAIYNLYTNKELWERISKNAYEFAKSEYSFEKGRRLVIKALEMVNIYVPYENYILEV